MRTYTHNDPAHPHAHAHIHTQRPHSLPADGCARPHCGVREGGVWAAWRGAHVQPGRGVCHGRRPQGRHAGVRHGPWCVCVLGGWGICGECACVSCVCVQMQCSCQPCTPLVRCVTDCWPSLLLPRGPTPTHPTYTTHTHTCQHVTTQTAGGVPVRGQAGAAVRDAAALCQLGGAPGGWVCVAVAGAVHCAHVQGG